MRKTVRAGVLALLIGSGLAVGTGVASAGTDGYVAGYDGAGMVSLRSTTPGENCITRRAIYVVHTDNPEIPAAKRADSAPGAGWVCVTREAYARYTIGQWWSGRSSGPRG